MYMCCHVFKAPIVLTGVKQLNKETHTPITWQPIHMKAPSVCVQYPTLPQYHCYDWPV